ncbi:MAG TPA: CvpA family protein [bacterium]|nr:CvpA family protein [bacterium]HPV65228.1 CvpA family protein [bacterium]
MIDIILLIFLSLFVIYGFYVGLVRMALNLLASILGIILSIKFYDAFYELFPFIGFGSDSLGKVISFIVVLSIISFILSFGFKLLGKILKIITSLPVISLANRLAGGAFGLIQGLFIIGAILFVLSYYAVLNGLLNFVISNSEISPVFIKAVYWLKPFIPEALKVLQSAII